ncbi:MAG TPA: ABC-F family ATP-binding cassette domain-containing protein [Bacteroidales bacterium]|nr:ABC-F family ATP-binding cassette domain-containing protein [Bacteroidales bacterium]HPS15657.1 ABC-F family ATP-binding cassette domain-containing protein [Bacteroidales bacterium]
MIYLQVENISKSFGEKLLFKNISFGVHKDQKIALIARNGTGKSTMLKIIAGLESKDTGSIVFRNDISFTYLDQNPEFNESLSVLEGVFASSKSIINIIKNYEAALVSGDSKMIADATDAMEINKAWDYETQIKQILGQLNITNLKQKIFELSGGQKKRLALANALISEPDLLILDEPTNHLDLEMIIWLEKYLQRCKSTLLMVTHDRYFLDRVCNDIIEIDDGKLFRHKGNYSYFLEKRDERIQFENTVIEKAQNILRTELEWMRRMPKARTTKSKSRIDSFYDIKEIASGKRTERNMHLDLQGTRLGKKILEINYISKKFEGIDLLENFEYTFKRNERIGIVGRNGCGKTTLLNIIAGLIPPDSGTIDVGETVSMGYYKQEGITFKEDQRVIDIAKDVAEVVKMSNGCNISVSGFLQHFLFTPEMQYTPVGKLSGGERRRLYLMTVLMKNPNFLILDEPTNDLDIITLNVLEEYLKNFNGCIVIVSHDRFFMDKIAEHLFVFEENSVVRDFPGNYTQYLEYKERIEEQEKVNSIKPEQQKKEKPVKEKPIKLTYKEQKEFEALELEIENLEKEKSEIEEAFASGKLESQQIVELSKRHEEIISLIETKTDRWLELSSKIAG